MAMTTQHGSETCEICGQDGFIGEAEVRSHMLLDHEENGGSCPLCDLAHITVEELNLHMNMEHRNILSPASSKFSHSAVVAATNHCHDSENLSYNGDAVLVAEEVSKNDALIYIEDYFGDPCTRKLQNGNFNYQRDTKNHHNSNGCDNFMNKNNQYVNDAHMILEDCSDTSTENDLNVPEALGESAMVENQTDTQNTTSGNSDDLFGDEAMAAVPQVLPSNGTINASSRDVEYKIAAESKVRRVNTKVTLLQPGRTGCDEQEIQYEKKNDRKRERKQPDVRPKSILMGSTGETISHQSMEITSTSTGETDSVKSETSSPFRKLLRTLTGSRTESDEEDKKDKSGIWVDLHLESEQDLLDDDSYIIEDALPADEVEISDISGTSGYSVYSTSTPSKAKKLSSSSLQTEQPKPTLLSLSKSAKNVQSAILCPICGLGSYDADFLNAHINSEHLNDGARGASVNDASSGGAIGGVDVSCPVCGLTGLGPDEMNVHVESHFDAGGSGGGASTSRRRSTDMEEMDRKLAEQFAQDEQQLQKKQEEEEFRKLQAKYGADGKGSFRKQSERNTSRAVSRGHMTPFEYHQQRSDMAEALATGVDSGQSCTKDIIPKLAEYYNNGVHMVTLARLSRGLDHFSSTRGDTGWGCGYRNVQMLLSAMVRDPNLRQVVFNGRTDIPSIPRIQLLIEDAWSKGFDAQGCDQLGGKVHSTRKWIGATEVVALFSALRIKCRLYDFHSPTGQNGTHPRLFAWIRDYFGKPSLLGMDNPLRSNKLPLYLQHEGHSRTIVGYDVLKDKSTRILLFDPSLGVAEAKALRYGEISGHTLKPVRKTLSQMKAKQYQIVSVEGLMSNDQDYERSKLLASQRIP